MILNCSGKLKETPRNISQVIDYMSKKTGNRKTYMMRKVSLEFSASASTEHFLLLLHIATPSIPFLPHLSDFPSFFAVTELCSTLREWA